MVFHAQGLPKWRAKAPRRLQSNAICFWLRQPIAFRKRRRTETVRLGRVDLAALSQERAKDAQKEMLRLLAA